MAGSPWGPAEPLDPLGPINSGPGLHSPSVGEDPEGPCGPGFMNALANDAVFTVMDGFALLAVIAVWANEELGALMG